MAKKRKDRPAKGAIDLQAELEEIDLDDATSYGTNPEGEFPQFEDEFPDLADTFPDAGQAGALVEVSLEELEEIEEQNRRERELTTDGPVDTQHSDGSAYYPEIADEQGLVYTPPTDPPVLPSADPQDIELAAGWSKSLEDADDPRGEDILAQLSGSDYDLQEKIYAALAKHSETNTLIDIQVEVRNGVVYLYGRVPTLLDTDLVENVIRDIDGVVDVEERLEVAALV
jgi:hypothetical protein